MAAENIAIDRDSAVGVIGAGHAGTAWARTACSSRPAVTFRPSSQSGSDRFRWPIISGDSTPAKKAIADLFDGAGFYPIDLGDVVSGGRMQQFGDHSPGITSCRARPETPAPPSVRMRT
jgi:hypothetical protein